MGQIVAALIVKHVLVPFAYQTCPVLVSHHGWVVFFGLLCACACACVHGMGRGWLVRVSHEKGQSITQRTQLVNGQEQEDSSGTGLMKNAKQSTTPSERPSKW